MMSHAPEAKGWPQPYPLLDAQPYWAALQHEQLTYQRCGACSQAVWPAHSFCPHCSSKDLTWQDSAGSGTVYTFSTVERGPTPLWQSIAPYTVGFVQMDEGYYLFTQFLATPTEITIGQRVAVKYERRGEQVLPIFAPA
jgi:uncharacterized OB-fold protein